MQRVATAFGVALIWVIMFKANGVLFAGFAHSQWAHWIFLPAGWRLVSVLLFEEAGAIGLAAGAFLTLPAAPIGEWPYQAGVAMTSGFAPFLAVRIYRHVSEIPNSLNGLAPSHVMTMSCVAAAANSALLNGYILITNQFEHDFVQVLAMFVGDFSGTAICLSAIAAWVNRAVKSRC